MNSSKVWMVVGATTGLGNAAIKYLVANKQYVIALAESDGAVINEPSDHLQVIRVHLDELLQIKTALAQLSVEYGSIDFVINNSNYHLFNQSCGKTSARIQRNVDTAVSSTFKLMTTLQQYLRKNPTGSIINIPPQLCLASLQDKADTERLKMGMEIFLKGLYEKLSTLDCGLTFLEPGERLTAFTV